MKVHVLQRRQVVHQPLETVFEFFSRPENLARLTPETLAFRILTPSPVVMKAGTLIDYTIRVLGMPVRWRTLITSYDTPHIFVDEQLKGPYAFWHHRHTFRSVEGGTEIMDEVHYVVPGGFLAPLVHAILVRPQLQRIFAFRQETIQTVFASGSVLADEANRRAS
ncbi:MAG: hypothetical protein H6Q31_1435 [Bacteroidetes bacterium]|jgi:hypothetical protein|nr:hypothetical protein [Bacteroidota bacterium]